MMWTLKYSPNAADAMRRLDTAIAGRIKTYMDDVVLLVDPRARGRGLTGALAGYWRYRVGDYRIIATIEDDRLVVIAVHIGHRAEVYDWEPRSTRSLT